MATKSCHRRCGSISKMRVLLVEDHPDIAENIGDYLEGRGHVVDFALDGVTGLHLAVSRQYDVLVVDVMLPGIGGLDLCRRFRTESSLSVPILLLTALDTLEDKLAGFEAGADDYLVKPFALEELGARLLALGRRGRVESRRLLVGDLELNLSTSVVRRAGVRLRLNQTTFKILQRLMEMAPAIVSKDELRSILWGDEPPESDALRTHIYSLRTSLDKPFDRPLLETIHGVGYRLIDDLS